MLEGLLIWTTPLDFEVDLPWLCKPSSWHRSLPLLFHSQLWTPSLFLFRAALRPRAHHEPHTNWTISVVWSTGGEDGDETQRLGDTHVEKFAGEVVGEVQ